MVSGPYKQPCEALREKIPSIISSCLGGGGGVSYIYIYIYIPIWQREK